MNRQQTVRCVVLCVLVLLVCGRAFGQVNAANVNSLLDTRVVRIETNERTFNAYQYPSTSIRGWVERSAGREAMRLSAVRRAGKRVQSPSAHEKNWFARHPIATGAMVGFAAGLIVGYASGDDGIFDDFTAPANGLFVGGIGAGIGAGVGAVIAIAR